MKALQSCSRLSTQQWKDCSSKKQNPWISKGEVTLVRNCRGSSGFEGIEKQYHSKKKCLSDCEADSALCSQESA